MKTIKFEDYLKHCLENAEFRKYWEEDIGVESSIPNMNVEEALKELNTIYDEDALYENKEQYRADLSNLSINKGVSADRKYRTSVELFVNDKGCPVLEFIEDISDEKLKEKTVKNIYDLATLGENARHTKLSKYVGDGILELRTKQGGNIDRIFYFFIEGNKIIMTNGYIKKTSGMDRREFERAKRYRDEYYSTH